MVGTANVLQASLEFDVLRFVNVSTDKAAQPANILGRSKRITERLVAGAAASSEQHYLSVRFGNVLGSSGSVLRTFETQALAGGPLTITNAQVTRYFMTVREAARFTIYALNTGLPGETLIPKLGRPVSILEVARQYAAACEGLEIAEVGLRPGEKLHEDLADYNEEQLLDQTDGPIDMHVRVTPLPFEALAGMADSDIERALIQLADG